MPMANATEEAAVKTAIRAAKTSAPTAAPMSLFGCGDSAMPTTAIIGMTTATMSDPENQQLNRTNGAVERIPSDTPHAVVSAQSPQAMSHRLEKSFAAPAVD